jgi:hypothetical protein
MSAKSSWKWISLGNRIAARSLRRFTLMSTMLPAMLAVFVCKLHREGYTGYLIRTSNDEKSGGQSNAQNILDNEQEHLKVAAALGCKDVFELYYQNHEMDAISSLDIRGRLIFLFRYLKVDTVISFNPWGPVEGNPDHGVTGRAC